MTEAIFDFAAIARVNRREPAVSKVEEATHPQSTCGQMYSHGMFGGQLAGDLLASNNLDGMQGLYNNLWNAGLASAQSNYSDLASMGQQAGNVGQPETA